MKRNIFLCIFMALTVLFALCLASCETGEVNIDINGDINLNFPTTDSDATDTNLDTSTGTGSSDSSDTDESTDNGSDNENNNQNENDNQGNTGNEDNNQGGTGNENNNQGNTGNEDNNQGGENNGDNNGDGNNESVVPPVKYTDEQGFVYIKENDELYCVDFVRPVDGTRVIFMPNEYLGLPVVGIKTNAFTDFGVAFNNSEYIKANYHYTIAIPSSIKSIEAAAFDSCLGIRICLYDKNELYSNGEYRLLDSLIKKDLPIILNWESKMVLFDLSEKSNKQARDSIWGFRPALGWTRYSAIEIPDYYE